jgi:hypothetical protein
LEDEEIARFLEITAPVNYPSILLKGINDARKARKDDPTTKFISAVRALRCILRKPIRDRVDNWLRENFKRLLDKYRKEFGSEEYAKIYAYEDFLSEIVDEIDNAGLLFYRPGRKLGGIF